MFFRGTILTLLIIGFIQIGLAKSAPDTFRIHTDFPYINKAEKLILDVFYISDSLFKGSLKIRFYKYQVGKDSICVLNRENSNFVFKKGINKRKIDFSVNDSNTSYVPKFYEILKRTNDLPPGSYKIFITVKNGQHEYQMVYLHEIDSTLSGNSSVRRDINKSLTPKSRSFLGFPLQNKIPNKKAKGAGNALSNSKHKVDRVAKKHGLTATHWENKDKSGVDLYYADWYAGRYEVKKNGSLPVQIKEQDKADNATEPNAATNNNLDHPSLMSQYKKKGKEKKGQEETKGEIGLTTNLNSGQDQGSGVDNNYYELRGRVELPVGNIPILLEGLYTSQDNHREIKSSYFRVHYDVEKMKENLGNSMDSYNNKFSQNKSKGGGMSQVYQSSINNLEGQKARLQSEINAKNGSKKTDYGKLADYQPKNEIPDGLHKKSEDSTKLDENEDNSTETDDSTQTGNDSSRTAKNSEKAKIKKEQALEDKRKIMEKQKQVDELDKKIKRYKTLLAQNENTNYFDSSIAYSKTKDIGSQDMSYKQMAKRGANLLPDGQAKSFLAGVTTADAGMFPKSESKYTMSGQMMKGADFGYDFGFCETGFTAGKTEYVGRDGNLDKYTFYSGKASFKPLKDQKMTFLYYGYTSDRKLSADNEFFKNAGISAPSFFQPVHIISTAYDCSVSKFVSINTEVATSFKQSDNGNVPVTKRSDKMAYHFTVDGKIPKTSVNLGADYDKTGKGFENSTLPILLAGTEQYKLTARNSFFHSFLTLGVEYNRLIQSNFVFKGSNTKWGFDLKTNSKRYPNVALSYKPFTTFRSFTDTLNIPQKPLFGSVWTGRVSYQVRRQHKTLRLSILYNRSLTVMDTTEYGSKLVQASAIYADKVLTSSVIIGNSAVTGTNVSIIPTAPNHMSFLSLNANYKLSKKISISGGQDFGVASFGFCKYSTTAGMMYHFKKPAIISRINFRYGTYILNEGEKWKDIFGGCLDLVYQFKAKNSKKNNF